MECHRALAKLAKARDAAVAMLPTEKLQETWTNIDPLVAPDPLLLAMDEVLAAGFLKEMAQALKQVRRQKGQKVKELLGALVEEAEKDIQSLLLLQVHQQDILKAAAIMETVGGFERVIGKELAGKDIKVEAAQLKHDPLSYTNEFEDY
jgi:hypothetical protein